MTHRPIVIRGAREHNLRNVYLELPRHKFIVFTGVSGSGKSSLAFDTLYAEGQRRYIESLSAGARAFLGQMEKPDVDHIEGLSPAISIEQKAAGHNPRSTVATMTEIYDYLRVLYARVGTPHCVRCGSPIGAQTSEEIIDRILQLPPGTRFQILAPIAQGRKGEFRDVFEEARRAGFVRVRVDGEILDLAEDIRLDRQRRHDIDLVIDRLVMKEGLRSRLADSVELALERGEGQLILNIVRLGEGTSPFAEGDLIFSRAYACLHCRQSYSEPTPQLFSFNSPQGMCPVCQGLGQKVELVPDLAVPDPSKSINEGAIVVWGEPRSPNLRHILEGLARHFHFSLDQPWETLSEEQQNVVLYGTNERLKFVYVSSDGRRYPYWDTYRGVLATYERKLGRTRSKRVREWVGQFIKPRSCPACGGARLRPEALAVTVGGKSIAEVTALTVAEAAHFFDTLELNQRQAFIAQDLLKEIRGRLHFLLTVGLHYLTLDRTAPTLSSGESQRIRLASQIGAGLVGVLYILDEPSIGLHPRDNKHLLATLKRLRDLGNTVIVAEHDEETMRAADFLVDFGPGPGRHGGEVVATGSAEEVARNPRSLTGQYLAGKRRIPIPQQRRRPADKWLLVRGARHHNLKSLDVAFPLGLFICVTGVSGSGKSSLVNDILYYALARDLNGAQTRPGAYTRIEGLEHLDKVIAIDQSPIGRTPRSNPATYTKALDPIRHLFAQLPEARARGYDPGRFSFNVPHKGRCEACEGYGWQRIEMDFLADVWVKCEVCGGTRFNRETLEVRYRGKNIAEVLEMTVAEALEHFAEIPSVRRVLQTLHDVGLDYIQLGQPAPTLSGGEAQRVKLARELAKRSTGRTLYILDEPTTGLHFADIQKLLEVLNRFVNQGNTVIVVEHNMEMVKCADYLIDLGPEGGEEGGYIVAAGPPEEVARNERSYTGRILREVLADGGKQKGEIPEIQADGQAQRRDRGAEVVEMTDVRTSPTPTPQPLNSLPEPFEPLSHILVRGAREHNLQGIDARIPREQMTIFTGVSGSGKTSLALDTIYAEGQRRYVESLSAYARQFINQLEKPRVDYVAGLSPAISIDQKSASPNPRSTVGTVTEVYDYLRILFARLGERYCVQCGGRVGAQTPDEMVERILQLPEGTRIYLLSPLILGRTEEYAEAFARARRDGFVRVRVDGQIRELGEEINIDRRRKHEVEIVVDRLVVRPDLRSRLADSVELALDKSGGTLLVQVMERGTRDTGQGARDLFFSQHCACQQCGESYEELTPQSFSFNSPLGWCPVCEGLGVKPGLDPGLIVPDERKSVREGAFAPWPGPGRNRQLQKQLEEVCLRLGIDPDVPLQDLPEEQRQMLLYGTGDGGGEAGIQPRGGGDGSTDYHFAGVVNQLTELYETGHYARDLAALIRDLPCPACGGERVRAEARVVRLRGKTIKEITDLTLREALEFFTGLELTEGEQEIVGEVMREIRTRLRFLCDLGLDYLTLSRPAPTLSGGEAQRIRLASQIGSGLTGVLYVLDEPTIGLHPRDTQRLLTALKHLRDLGNTVIVVEHDAETIRNADFILDFGPGAGINGGRIVAQGSPAEVARQGHSLTGQYLSGRKSIPLPRRRRAGNGLSLVVRGARHHNLKNIDVRFPLGTFICVTGVSGSGKSSLVNEVLYRALANELHRARYSPGQHEGLEGVEYIDKVIAIDQSPIGTTPRSDPATYVGVFDEIRALYAMLPESRARGYTPARFSFNRPGGRCEACWGYGYRKIEMHFLADVWVKCEVCNGARYNQETLQIKYRDQSIADVLNMTVAEAREHFAEIPRVRRILQTLADVGLDYLRLGQSAPTLSGGEAQRVKLAKELSRPSTGQTLYLLDEPTTGLHFEDVKKLLEVLNRLVDAGNTVVCIEHNLEVIKTADYIIDLGPEGGEEGGYVVAAGPPEEVAACEESHTGRILREYLPPNRGEPVVIVREASTPYPVKPLSRAERWHKLHLAFAQERDALWTGEDLQAFIDLVREVAPEVSAPNWEHPEYVELRVEGVKRWWCRIKTTHPIYFRVMLRAGRNPFGEGELRQRLGLQPWLALEPPVECRTPRVAVKRRPEGWEVWLHLWSRREFDTAALREVIREMVEGFKTPSM